jgi:CTP:molybdopterin cytidylyltransferase MocA
VIQAALRSPAEQIVVVVGASADQVRGTIPEDPRIDVVENARHRTGQASSLRTGLDSLRSEVEAAVILLGDQPRVAPSAVDAVVAAWRAGAGPVVRASYSGRPGHPTLCDRAIWPALHRIGGDTGVRALLAEHPDWSATVELGGEPPADIDTEADYRRIRETYEGA